MIVTEDPCMHCDLFEKRNLFLDHFQDNLSPEIYGRYKELYEIAPIGLYRTRIHDDKLIECNRAFVQLMGYSSKQECLNKCSIVRTYIDPKELNHFSCVLEEKKKIEGFQTKIKPNGSIVWVEITAELFSEKGFIEGSIRDISVSKLLTPAEKKVLGILLEGKSNSAIAYTLKRSVRTIEDHRARIMKKLGVNNLIELTKKALILPGTTLYHLEETI